MDTSKDNSIERVVSQRALQMGNSFPCQICVFGVLFGACLATLFLAALSTSLGTFAFGGISFSATAFSSGITSWNSSSDIINMVTEQVMYSQLTSDSNIDERASFLYSTWTALLDESMKRKGRKLPRGVKGRRSKINVPKAPHLENCKLSEQLNKKLDKRVANGSFPPWTLWKGHLDTYPSSTSSERLKSDGAYPPWGVRYLMRFQTEYTCNLLNAERHSAFGRQAAKLVLATPNKEWLEEVREEPQSEIERFVVGFEEYMNLAERIRKRFPHVHNILVSTEMQEVIDKLGSYPHWNFYYTNVTRQVGNTSMAAYTASLGRKTSTNYPLVNFLLAAESDFFIGALGSTWSYLIDGMRNTGGKVMAGYLSVNMDRYW
ncbi:hypothetical protein RHSIM_Rhsim09G0136200 [Rhododendron simsii]|uniref:Uncharacterized protein n=1 Tax=Rhododendron simsii TaxID=118357 RepID=A0A834LEY7_RHOSS|nr:hypothetical protein RHSIM_Rhsim09G0136200 [Rhododendron simsii]